MKKLEMPSSIMLYIVTVERPVTFTHKPDSAVTMSKRAKTEPTKSLCHRILCTPATYSVSSIGVTINQTPHRFTFMGHEISMSADSPVKLDSTDRKILDFILILLTKYLSATGPWTDGWVSFTIGDVLHRFDIDPGNHRDDKEKRISRTYFDIICRALDKLALLRLSQDGAHEFGLVESYHLAKQGGEAQKKDVIAGRGCFVVQMPQSLLDHLAEQGVTHCGKLRILPFINSLFYAVSDNAYAIAKRMMAHFYFRTNYNSPNRDRLRVQTLVGCCPALNAKLPEDRRRTFNKALVSLTKATASGDAIIPCRYATGRPPIAHEDWLNAVIQFEPHEVEYISREDLDTAHELFPSAGDQQPTHDVDEQESEPAEPVIQETITPDKVDKSSAVPVTSAVRPTVRPYTSPSLQPAVSAPRGGTPSRAPTAPNDSGDRQWDIPLPGLVPAD